MLDMHFGTIPGESTASTTAQQYGLFSSSNPGFQFQVTPQEIWAIIMCGGSNMVMDPSVHPEHLNVVEHLYVLDMLLGTILGASTDSTTAQQFGMMPSSDTDTGFQSTPPICTNSCSGSGMVMDLSAHPHHIKVVKHLAYV